MPLVTKTFSDIITFTRTSGATYFDSNGVLQTAGNNVPRLDYNPSTLAAQGLLIEEQRTNSLLRSAEFDNALWTAIITKNVTPNTNTAPDGTLTADTVSDSSAAAFQGIFQNVTVAADTTTYTASIYVKKTTGGTSATFGLNLQISGGTTVVTAPRFNTDTGTVLNGTASVQNAGSYWRFVVSVTNNGSVGNTTLALSVYPATAAYNSGVDTPTATGSAVVWGAQIETGSFPTSYIPTTTTALTRSADVASVNTLSPWFNATEGGLYVEWQSNPTAYARYLVSIEQAASSATRIDININAGNTVNPRTVVSGAAVATLSGGTYTAGTIAKVAFGYKSADYASSLNGAAAVTATTAGALPSSLATMYLGSITGGTQVNGWLRRLTFYPRRLSNAELVSITT